MSKEYDEYLAKHKAGVMMAYRWLSTNIPDYADPLAAYNITAHDESKTNMLEYEAYDAYFYGDKTEEVITEFKRAWLEHIHANPHHWQHWVLINDDPKEGVEAVEMPRHYIIEMVCDWWSFSWIKEDLSEIFSWYDEHSSYMILADQTRKTVEDILQKIRKRLADETIEHHGIKDQKWGVRNGPPYPLDKSRKSDTIVTNAIKSGEVSKTINREKQLRHTKSHHTPGRSYLDGDLDYAQALVDGYSGKGEAKVDRHGVWNHRERITLNHDIGVYIDEDGNEMKSNAAMIVYSNTGTHVYPARRKESK